MTDDDPRRRELGSFLRSRRERISPESVGLPVGRRRRTAGLRREEVAILAGVSPTWYTYLEQGRDIHPSPTVLDGLARVLQLSEDERSYMYLLACGRRPVQEAPSYAPVAMERMFWDLARAYGPYPVFVANQRGDVLAWNDAAADWYTDFAELPAERRNMVWWMLVEPAARERLVKWEEEARVVVARLRAASAAWPGDRRMVKLVAELHDASPEMRQWWSDHEIHGQALRVRWLRHPRLGVQPMYLMLAYPAGTGGIGVAFHVPCTEVPRTEVEAG